MFLRQLWCHCRSCNSFRVTTSRAAGTWLQKCWSVPSLMYRISEMCCLGEVKFSFRPAYPFYAWMKSVCKQIDPQSLLVPIAHASGRKNVKCSPFISVLIPFHIQVTWLSLAKKSHISCTNHRHREQVGEGLGRSKTPVNIVVRRKYASPLPSDPLFLDYKIVKNFQYFPLKFDQYVAPNCF